MTPIEKFAAITALCDQFGMYSAALVCSDVTHKVYVSAPIEIAEDGMLTGVANHAESFDDAVNQYWDAITNIPPGAHLRVGMKDGDRRVRWNGYMWKDVSR